MKKTQVLLGITGLLTAALTGFLVKRAPADPPRSVDPAPAEAPSAELAALEREVASLKRMAGAQAARTSTLAATVGNAALRQKQSPPPLPPAEHRRLLGAALEDRYHA